MATYRDWPDGKAHSIPYARHLQNVNANNPNGANLGQIVAAGGLPQALAAPAAAPGPAAPVAAPQPYDPAYQASVTSANRNVALGNNEATWQTQQTGYDLGYDQNGQFNAANPYSQAQLLQDNYKRSQLGTTNSMAAQGQLYSGAIQNARATDDRNYSQSDAALRRQAVGAYHGIQAGQLNNYATNSVGVSDASFNSLLKSTYGG